MQLSALPTITYQIAEYNQTMHKCTEPCSSYKEVYDIKT